MYQGGNTGVVGGSVPIRDEAVLSTTKMNRIREFDATSGTVVVEAGVTLQVAVLGLNEWDSRNEDR